MVQKHFQTLHPYPDLTLEHLIFLLLLFHFQIFLHYLLVILVLRFDLERINDFHALLSIHQYIGPFSGMEELFVVVWRHLLDEGVIHLVELRSFWVLVLVQKVFAHQEVVSAIGISPVDQDRVERIGIGMVSLDIRGEV